MKPDVAAIWYRPSLHPLVLLLLPFSFLFGLCAALRRGLYRFGFLKTHHFKVPVIVVGNITVGGTGKTPFVLALVNLLRSQGYTPGIVSRGVGGKKNKVPHVVKQDDAPGLVGDEALLLARRAECPVVVAIDRVAAVRELLQQHDCDIVISDDGLQHYRLGRQKEIVLVDAERGLGNQCLLPAGPLREPRSRLRKADMVVMHGESESEFTMSLVPVEFVSIVNPEQRILFSEFTRQKVYAVAGIGHPQRFFAVLKNAGFDVITRMFPDHHAYQPRDLDLAESCPILMTEKDAVKCAAFADERYWYLRVEARLSAAVEKEMLNKLSHSPQLRDRHNWRD